MGCAARKSQKPPLELRGWAGGAYITMDPEHGLVLRRARSDEFLSLRFLFLDGTFVSSANDHSKGPNHLQLSIQVPTKKLADGDSPRKLLLLSLASKRAGAGRVGGLARVLPVRFV